MLEVGWFLAGFLLLTLAPIMVTALFPRRFARQPSLGDEPWPEVTLVVPARNEGDKVREAFASVLGLDYPALRIVAINDRSQDHTGSVLEQLAEEDPRVTVLHIEELPGGWLGKNHANWLGAQATTSPWILFTDADVRYAPDALRKAVQHAHRTGIDHLTLFPSMIPGGVGENLMVCAFGLLLSMRFQTWLVRSRWKHCFVGIGAFNLIRRTAYEALGGHRRMALEVVDDMKLGKLVKLGGFRQDAMDADGLIQIRWQSGVRGIVEGLTKNTFASLNYSLGNTILNTLLYFGLYLLPYLGAVAAGGADRYGFLTAVAVLQTAFAILVWRAQRNPLISLLLPIALALFLYIIWRSAWVTLRQGGVIWRDTFYSLETLRRGMV